MDNNQKNILETLNDGPVAIIGIPGDGKITKLTAIMEQADRSCFTISLRLLAGKHDFATALEPCRQYARSFPDSDVYLILDEAGTDMPEEILKTLETIVTERRIDEVTYPENLKPIIVMNHDRNVPFRRIYEKLPFMKHMLLKDNSQPMSDDAADLFIELLSKT